MSKCLLSTNDMPNTKFKWGITKAEWSLGQEHRVWNHEFKSHLSCDKLGTLGQLTSYSEPQFPPIKRGMVTAPTSLNGRRGNEMTPKEH